MNLSSRYLGCKIDNPIVVGASPLTGSLKGLKRCADAGAGALVLRSLFEEEIREQTRKLDDSLFQQVGLHDEVYQYLEAEVDLRYGIRDYLALVEGARNETDIPIIASVNCISDKWWVDYVQELEAAGANGLELNVAILPKTARDTARDIEQRYLKIIREAVDAVKIPVSIKLGPYFTSLPEILNRFHEIGISGFILFNRFYRPTIDIDEQKIVIGDRFSHAGELSVALRNIALCSGSLPCDFIAATGVHEGADVIRAVLAGAKAVQIVTTLMQHKPEYIRKMLDDIAAWMTKHNYSSLEDFRGQLSQGRNAAAELFTRTQYIEALSGH